MKPFRFNLEVVLEARRAQEEEARLQLSLALDRHREAVNRNREAVAGLSRVLDAIAAASSGRFNVADRERSSSIRQAQERICAEAQVAVQECNKIAEQKRVALMQARRDRELLERLKESKRSEWNREADRLQGLALDEFAMTRRHQAQLQHATC